MIKFADYLHTLPSSPLTEAVSALYESASSVLYHFCTPYTFCQIASSNEFIPANTEQDINGDGVNFMSFSRTGSFREGYPVLLQASDGCGAKWGVVRLTLDGDLLNRYSTFKVGHGKGKPKTRHSMKFQPFDWAHNKYGDDFGEEYDIDETISSGKEWMMASDAQFDVAIPYDDMREPSAEVPDRYGHPYSQAEDRMTTDAVKIPGVNRFIKSVDIILNLENFDADNEDERDILLDEILSNPHGFKSKIHLYSCARDCELRRNEMKPSVLLDVTSGQFYDHWKKPYVEK